MLERQPEEAPGVFQGKDDAADAGDEAPAGDDEAPPRSQRVLAGKAPITPEPV